MDTREIKINELKNILEKELNYNFISGLSKNQYRSFIYNLFSLLNDYKQEGVRKEDIEGFINKLHTDQSYNFNDNLITEDMFSFITEEILNFCPSPFFWDVSLQEYMKKWETIYFPIFN